MEATEIATKPVRSKTPKDELSEWERGARDLKAKRAALEAEAGHVLALLDAKDAETMRHWQRMKELDFETSQRYAEAVLESPEVSEEVRKARALTATRDLLRAHLDANVAWQAADLELRQLMRKHEDLLRRRTWS